MSTSARVPIALVVHGHFYQPPRDNPWTDEVPPEPSAAPHRDWNARIHAECYRANAYARLHGADDRIRALANNYDHISFNFGPTLARWIARHDTRTAARIRAGDEHQRQRWGTGGALAQVWSHAIAPLCSPRDRRTQILWGQHDFRRRFGHEAKGMWLPETAADATTLEDLIDAGIRYTILAPEQIAAVRAPGEAWKSVSRDSVDTGRAYRWVHGDGSGRSIAVAVFDGPLSRDLAFGNASRDAATLLQRVKQAAARSSVSGRALVLAASDGELFGHHKKFADLTLAYATRVEAAIEGVEVTNLGAFLADEPPTWEVDLAKGPHGEGTAWSCAHGLGRWRRHCGCAMRPPAESGWSQAWRGPLRDALDLLRDRAAAMFEDLGGDLFSEPWETRDGYGAVVDEPVAARARYLRQRGRRRLRQGETASLARAHRLLELQRSTLLMYASCGWFFDDIAGLESTIVLRYAAHVLDLWRQLGGRPPVGDFLDVLRAARSNLPEMGTGADVFRRASGDKVTPVRAVAQVAFATLAGDSAPPGAGAPGFEVSLAAAPLPRKLRGSATVVHRRSGERTKVAFTASYDGLTGFELVSGNKRLVLDDLDEAAARPLRLAALDRLAASPPTLAACRTALELGAPLPTAGPDGEQARAAFSRLLLRLLDSHAPGHLTPGVLAVVEELVDRANLAARSDESHRAEDLVWETITHFRAHKKALPTALRVLAERLHLAVEPA